MGGQQIKATIEISELFNLVGLGLFYLHGGMGVCTKFKILVAAIFDLAGGVSARRGDLHTTARYSPRADTKGT